MRWRDYFRLSWDQLRRRKVVTAMCAIGIAIGSSSIMVALAFGESITHYTELQMKHYLKTDEITVSDQEVDVHDDKLRQKLHTIQTIPHVKSAATFEQLGYYRFDVDETKHGNLELIATDLEVLDDFGYKLQQGAVPANTHGIIITYGAMYDIYDDRTNEIRQKLIEQNPELMDSLNELNDSYPLYQKTLILKTTEDLEDGTQQTFEFPVRVSGIIEKPEGTSTSMLRYDSRAFISPELAEEIKQTLKHTASFQNQHISKETKVIVDAPEHVEITETLIQKLKMDTSTNLHRQEQMQNEFVILRLIFGGIGMFVLLVASISIVVAMTMSTYQRRRQIGIMKVLGANLHQIRNMFIFESSLLGLLGGLLGILLSYWVIWSINFVINTFSGGPGGSEELLFIRLWILPVGIAFAVLTGVLSGIYPAVKASRTDALSAIKRE